MQFNHSTGAIAFLLVTPLVTGLTVGIAPSNAATIAGSTAQVIINNFSHRPTETDTSTDINTATIANDGVVISQANADAAFISNCHELLAKNLSKSEVAGSGSNYAGLAQSQASVIGDFEIDAKETFSFAVKTDLNLFSSVDNRQSERASARGSIFFGLIDTVTNILLDSVQITSSLDSSDGFTRNVYSSSKNFDFSAIKLTLRPPYQQANTIESLFFTSWRYSRTFESATSLRLVEIKNNLAEVQAEARAEAVPEPSTILGTTMFLALLVRARKLKNKLSEAPLKV
ncbi:PEP-CTERM sorting domain-containing protein [Microcoleus sp. bin38.metabat.b11b12b14.051]|uniref:PEP-CTERM sorting domain-containing protein n=1 Tax=Microcoleus sp. bin38.metabat.b11b12b14.051 TaxID=2742709 RepID=UPI0025F716DC|nr:PEP-CTERM sorting domain-containing protein [Microcoleus sp. bin38.metabat.b11b12b14.051]